ncbi:MAG: hypothetical protein O9353_12060, partial [Bacteroidia bacterium]|nr:hypothetical protein [Bacteroidia bacterium]
VKVFFKMLFFGFDHMGFFYMDYGFGEYHCDVVLKRQGLCMASDEDSVAFLIRIRVPGAEKKDMSLGVFQRLNIGYLAQVFGH